MSTVKLPFYARLALTLLAIVLIFLVLSQASGIVIPLVFALLISILLFPLNKFLETRLHFSRSISAITSVLLFVSALIGFVYFLAFQLIGFAGDFPLLRKKFMDLFDGLQNWLSLKLHITSKQQSEYMNHSINSILESVAHSASNLVISVTGIILVSIFVALFTFFMLYHRNLLKRFVLHLFTEPHREKVSEVIMETKGMINAYVQGLLIEMVVISVVTSSMFMVMGIQYALLLGVMSAVLNIIPYLGIYTSMAICVLVTLTNGTGGMALEVAIGMFIVHFLDSNVLFPRIVGGRMKMNPFVTIIAVIVGEFLWGIPGMFLFIPVVGILKLICERVEGMEAWALLIGVEDVPKKPKHKVNISDIKS